MRPLGCEFPVEPDACGKPATWTTDDLQEISYLCDEHVNEALLSDSFNVERVQ